MSLQSNVSCEYVIVGLLSQRSDAEIPVTSRLPSPFASNTTVCVAPDVIEGAVTSEISTVIVVTVAFPYESNTKAVTLFEPKSSQS